MKKLLALLTAPLTMTACIDLSNVENANVGTDGEVNNPGETMTGFAALRSAYMAGVKEGFVSEFEDVKAQDSLASVAVMATCDIDSAKGNFNSTAALTFASYGFFETRTGEYESGDGKSVAKYVDDQPFYNEHSVINAWGYEHSGYIDYTIDDDNGLEYISNEYKVQEWDKVSVQAQIKVENGSTQVWTNGLMQDVIELSPSVFAHRQLNSSGLRELVVFNTITDAIHIESTINPGNACSVGTGIDAEIENARNKEWFGTSETFDTTNVASLFETPTFDFTIDEIKAKLS